MFYFSKRLLIQPLLWVLFASILMFGCSSTPKNVNKKTYARVKDWRSNLGLKELESQYGLPDGLLSAVMHQESGGKINARSSAGAQGLFQIMPGTARDLSLASAYEPQDSARAAARYLSQLYRRYNGNLKQTLAAYNWGMGNVDRWINNGQSHRALPRETQNYIASVKKLKSLYD